MGVIGAVIPCSNCSGTAVVVDSRKTATGQRRRWKCGSCGYAWTTYGGDDTVAYMRVAEAPVDMIRDVLTSDLSTRELAIKYKLSRSFIRKVQVGQAYRDVLPELPRHEIQDTTISCEQCQHWQHAKCDLDFPDPLIVGVRFGRSCNLFKAAS